MTDFRFVRFIDAWRDSGQVGSAGDRVTIADVKVLGISFIITRMDGEFKVKCENWDPMEHLTEDQVPTYVLACLMAWVL